MIEPLSLFLRHILPLFGFRMCRSLGHLPGNYVILTFPTFVALDMSSCHLPQGRGARLQKISSGGIELQKILKIMFQNFFDAVGAFLENLRISLDKPPKSSRKRVLGIFLKIEPFEIFYYSLPASSKNKVLDGHILLSTKYLAICEH